MHKNKIIIKIITMIISLAISSVAPAVSFGADTLRAISFANVPGDMRKNIQETMPGSFIIKVVFFDLGNVIDFFDCHRASRAIAAHCNIPEREGDIYLAMRSAELLEPLETGRANLAQFFEKLKSSFGLEDIDYPTFVRFYTDVYEANPPVWRVIKQLKEAGYKIGVISNTDEVMFEYERNAFKDVFDMIDIVVTSYEVGVKKPDEKIFRKALEKAGVRAEQAVFIDDIAAYTESFSSLGGRGIQYTPQTNLYKEIETALIKTALADEIKNKALQVILQSA